MDGKVKQHNSASSTQTNYSSGLIKVTDFYFYQTNTALYPVKSENSPTTADDRWLLRKQKVDWLL